MQGMRLFFAVTLAGSVALSLFAALVYLPWFRAQLERRDPLEFERAGPLLRASQAPRACLYFLRRDYLRSFEPSIRRHGNLLRWAFSFPLLLTILTLTVASIASRWLH